MHPLLLPPNLIEHYYRGGDRIAALRGIKPESDHHPEEWLGSTVTRFGEKETGLAITATGEFLRDIIAADPETWTGGQQWNPSDTGILVKLLDARQRLPIHAHPTRDFAAAHLDCPYGKTEAWYVLDAVGDAAVYLGWKADVDGHELERRRDDQDSQWLLTHMNRVPVESGMGILCPAGTPHAIGEGVFVLEVQEPTDYSILLEWSVTSSTREDSHLDLGFDKAMEAVSTSGLTESRIHDLVRRQTAPSPLSSVLHPEADPYFRLSIGRGNVPHSAPAEVERGFAIVVAISGTGYIESQVGSVPLQKGNVYAVPQGFNTWRLDGPVTALIAQPGR